MLANDPQLDTPSTAAETTLDSIAISPNDPYLKQAEAEQRRLVARVYLLMMTGLLLSACVARWITLQADSDDFIARNMAMFEVLFLFEVISVAILSRAIARVDALTAGIVFFVYAAFNGVSFSVFLRSVPANAIAYGFVMAAATFGTMLLYGHYSNADLSRTRSMVMMLVVGLGLMSAANLAMQASVAYWATSYLGVIIFADLTWYHAQDIRDMYMEFDDDPSGWKSAIIGALLIYLDFINLYFYAMRFLGQARGGAMSKR